jgi:hypothetical protein
MPSVLVDLLVFKHLQFTANCKDFAAFLDCGRAMQVSAGAHSLMLSSKCFSRDLRDAAAKAVL